MNIKFKEMGMQFAYASFSAATHGIVGGIRGGLVGFIYSKLANKPVFQTTQAFAIWYAAEGALASFVAAFTNNESHKFLIHTVVAIAGSVGITELRRRGILGDKMMIFLCAGRALTVALFFFAAAVKDNNPNNHQPNENPGANPNPSLRPVAV